MYHHLLMRRVRVFVQTSAVRFKGKSSGLLLHEKMVHSLSMSPERIKPLWGQGSISLIWCRNICQIPQLKNECMHTWKSWDLNYILGSETLAIESCLSPVSSLGHIFLNSKLEMMVLDDTKIPSGSNTSRTQLLPTHWIDECEGRPWGSVGVSEIYRQREMVGETLRTWSGYKRAQEGETLLLMARRPECGKRKWHERNWRNI